MRSFQRTEEPVQQCSNLNFWKKKTTTSATTAKKKQKKGKTYIPGGFSTSAVPDNIEKYYKLSWKWNRVKQTSHIDTEYFDFAY